MKRLKKILKWILGTVALLLLVLSAIAFFYLNISFKGNVEYVKFNSDIPLEGVLVKPDNTGPHPVILLLHGAGSHHQAYDKLYFKFHANAFVEAGFAVLIYSKRSDNEVDYSYFTYEDLMGDANAAIAFLKEREDIDQGKMGVMGVSESGWFTPQLAIENPEIRFLINRVSTPLSVLETTSHEVKSDALAMGFSEEDVQSVIVPMHKRMIQFYMDIHEKRIDPNGDERSSLNEKLYHLNQDEHYSKWYPYTEMEVYDSLRYAAVAKRYSYDPMPYFEKSEIPMLYILAGKDKNIPTQRTRDILNEAKKYGKNITVKVYPEATHYLYKHGLEDGPFEGWMYYNDYLDTLTSWAKEQLVE